MRIAIVLTLILMLFFGVIGYIIFAEPQVTEQTLADAETAMAGQDLETAKTLLTRYLEENPDSIRANSVAGDLYLRMNEPDTAYEHFEKLLVDENPNLMESRFNCARLAMSLGRAIDAEAHMRAVLDINQDHGNAHLGLFEFLRAQGRNNELAPHFMFTIRQPQAFDLKQLLVMAAPHSAHLTKEDGEFVDACMKTFPDEPLPLLGQARSLVDSVEVMEAIPILSQICEKHPKVLTAQGLLGSALVRFGSNEQIKAWIEQLPENADEYAEIWLAKGDLAARNQNQHGAARCYWEGLKRDPIHNVCAYRLGRLLSDMEGYEEQGAKLQDYATGLYRLTKLVFDAGPREPGNMRKVVDEMVKYGRLWEAAGWCYAAGRIPSQQSWAQIEAEKLLRKLREEPPFILPEASPANDLDFSEWAIPSVDELVLKVENVPIEPPMSGAVSFKNDARSKGIEFRFNTAATDQARMFEFSGGGANIIDFDRDGWPDVYFTQGAMWPVNPEQDSFLDTIYRNVGGEVFEDVGSLAMEGDNAYSQGASVGDFDNDGFQDVFVGNIGANSFYHNNGDGTFSKMDLPEQIAGSEWTIGTMLADITGDGSPDIYAVNYLAGDEPFTRTCEIGPNRNAQCPVGFFDAADDQFIQNDGQGGFASIDGAGVAQPGGKGMGVVAFRRSGGAQSILVANDTTPNFLLNAGDTDFAENARSAGIAVGANGDAQSCMGIAAGDVNNDGLMDFFVTNYSSQPNNLFLQLEEGLFSDEIGRSGIRELGFTDMGWGAQFLDANLDGHLDLIVANGGLEALGPDSGSEQRAQFFRNVGDGRFVSPEGRTGEFFQNQHFGRAVARVDWNRDGLPDVFFTRKSAPPALLTNTTKEHGDSVRLTLIGNSATSSRDAVGTVVTITTDAHTLTRQVTAGDGFQCTNQKSLIFGIAEGSVPKSIKVVWPSGTETMLDPESVSRNADLVLIEGNDRVLELPR